MFGYLQPLPPDLVSVFWPFVGLKCSVIPSGPEHQNKFLSGATCSRRDRAQNWAQVQSMNLGSPRWDLHEVTAAQCVGIFCVDCASPESGCVELLALPAVLLGKSAGHVFQAVQTAMGSAFSMEKLLEMGKDSGWGWQSRHVPACPRAVSQRRSEEGRCV